MGQFELGHREVLIRVKAPVDAGVAEIVSILNEFPGLWTLNSCEGKEGVPAFVDFRYGVSPQESAAFLIWLSKHLAGRHTRLTAEWGGGETLVLTLSAPKQIVKPLATELRNLAKTFRKSRFACGTAHKESRSSTGYRPRGRS